MSWGWFITSLKGRDRPPLHTDSAKDRRGTSAIEFAVLAPVVFAVLVGVYDVCLAMILRQEVFIAAHTIVTSASSLAVQRDNTTSLTVSQVQQVLSGIYAAMPTLRNGQQSGPRSATLTSVNFAQTDPTCVPSPTVACNFVPYAVWSVAYADPPGRFAGNSNSFTSITRCPSGHTPLKQVTPANYAPGDMTSLPTANVVNPLPILVADAHYQYSPFFFAWFMTAPVDLRASSLWVVRSINSLQISAVPYTQYDLSNQAGGAGQCP